MYRHKKKYQELCLPENCTCLRALSLTDTTLNTMCQALNLKELMLQYVYSWKQDCYIYEPTPSNVLTKAQQMGNIYTDSPPNTGVLSLLK